MTVLDLTRLLPGGFCSQLLADFGADVIKVEDTGAGDYIRHAPPFYEPADQGEAGDAEAGDRGAGEPGDRDAETRLNASATRSALYVSLNRGKRSIRLDLKSDGGREAFLRLAATADVILDGNRPGVAARLGVDYESVRGVNPGIVYCAITGYGQNGPNRDRAGHDINYLAATGMLGLTGRAGGPAIQPAGQIGDIGGGALPAAFGVMAALMEKQKSGLGQMVDISMTDGALSWLAMVAGRHFADGTVPKRGELELAGGLVCYLTYEAADGWVSCGALEVKFWQAFCQAVGRPDLVEAQFERPGGPGWEKVAEVFRSRTRAEWKAFNDRHDCWHRADPRPRRGARIRSFREAGNGGRNRPARDRPGPSAGQSGQAFRDPCGGNPAGTGDRSRHRRRAVGGRADRGRDRGAVRIGRSGRARRRIR